MKGGLFLNITGIICEYNPLHLGHKKQLDAVRRAFPDGGIVCLMSGNYVQRGMPAVFDKGVRAKAALLSGADLVLELPVTAALSSAEGFAARGVEILSGFCHKLCFGAETPDPALLTGAARVLLSPEFSDRLRVQLDAGLSFPAARQKALEALGVDTEAVSRPNNILAVEYCKAILSQNSKLQPFLLQRAGDYHAAAPHPENPSATALRALAERGKDFRCFVPEQAFSVYKNASVHTLKAGELSLLARLRQMTDAEFAALPYGSEGLWRKLMHAARREATLEDILTATKSKRYTRTRLDRMVMCAFLGITQQDMDTPAPYVRVLALNSRGREILKQARRSGTFLNAGEQADSAFQALENRCGDLYGLFCTQGPEAPGAEPQRRMIYLEN